MNKAIDTGIDEITKRKIIGILHALIPEGKIYLFGSRARGTHSQGSDVDIAIDIGSKVEPHIRIGEAREVLNGLYTGYRFDVLDFNRASDNMKYFILKEGILWN